MSEASVYRFSTMKKSIDDGFLLDLIARAKIGDQEAFAAIYDLYFTRIYRFIYYRVGHKEVAEDLSEDVFVKVFTRINSVEKEGSFQSWLYQIARNKVIDFYRDKRLTVALEDIENTLEYESNLIDIVELKEQQKIFLRLLKELGTDQQTILKLKFLEDLDNSEIARLTGKTEGSIRVLQHRAISKLKELLNKF